MTWFGRYLPPFVTLLSSASAQLGQALDMLQKQSGLYEEPLTAMLDEGAVGGVDLNALTYQENVLDTPTIITRAALYIFLNAMVRVPGLGLLLKLTYISLLDDQYMTTLLFSIISMHAIV